MGFNMVRCSRLKKHNNNNDNNKVEVKVRRENKADFEAEVEPELFRSMPEQLLTEILLRLPSRSVCRFKLVCKNWCSLLSSHYFVRRYNNHIRQCCPFTLVFQCTPANSRLPNDCEISHPIGAISNHPVLSKSLRNRPLDLNLKRHLNINFLKNHAMYVLASSHDLLLCRHLGAYYVVNLLTRCWIEVPHPPIRDQDRQVTPLSVFEQSKVGLLCCHNNNNNGDGLCKFKVIILPALSSTRIFDADEIGRVIPPEIYASQFTIRIFSSESRQWVDIRVDWYTFKLNAYLGFTPILSHEGKLHWLNGLSLVSLDVNNLSTHSVDLPNELSLKVPCGFGVCQGQFRVARLFYEGADVGRVLLVWDLEDGVWQLAHRVLLRHQPSLKEHKYKFTVMAFHPFDRDIVFVAVALAVKPRVFQFNMRTGKLKSYYQLQLPKLSRSYIPVLGKEFPLLVHPRLPTAVSAFS